MIEFRLGFSCFFGEAGIIAPQVGAEKIIKYFIDIIVTKYIIPLFIA
jgi:hypothetical protein